MFKKTVSLILSVILVAGSIAIGVSAVEKTKPDLVIAVASDLHYNQPDEELIWLTDDPIYGYANRRAAMDNESSFILDEFLNQCRESEPDFVLIAGDLVDNGRTIIEDHEAVAEKLDAFEEDTGIPVYITNGNHDFGVAEGDTNIDDFKRIYNNFGFSEAIETLEGTCSYTVDLGEKYRLIAADSCDHTVSTEDGFTSARVKWVCEQAEKAYADGRYPILMMHHNVLSHMPVQRVLSHDFIVRNHNATAEKLANAGIKTVITGHEHGNDVMTFTSLKGNKLTDFSITSLSMYPCEFKYFEFTDEEIKYTTAGITGINTEALQEECSGYTEDQINAMNEDFREFSKQFLKAGVQYRLWLGMTPEKLGIPEDAFYYDLVITAVTGLTDLLEMPLYGEGGVQELAKEYNIDIPDSEYKNGWDVATEVVSYHYAGNEPFALDSTEVTIVLRMVDLILLDDLSTVNDRIFLKAANSILENLGTNTVCKDFTKLAANTFGPVTAGEYFLLSIASPLLYGLAYDRDGIDDCNGTIEGYGVGNNTENIRNNIKNIFSMITLYFSMFLGYLSRIFIPG